MNGLKNYLAALALAALGGCVQYPTEKQSIADVRPQISFHFNTADEALGGARVMVDGIDAGALGNFAAGVGALRVRPGTHEVAVVLGSETLLRERAYLADGASKPFHVSKGAAR